MTNIGFKRLSWAKPLSRVACSTTCSIDRSIAAGPYTEKRKFPPAKGDPYGFEQKCVFKGS